MTWDRTPLGLKTALPVSRALRWLRKGRKDAEISVSEAPALHREAERDTTGNFGRQHPLTYVDRRFRAREASLSGNTPFFSADNV